MKLIAVGQRRAIICASWPAPLGIRILLCPCCRATRSAVLTSRGRTAQAQGALAFGWSHPRTHVPRPHLPRTSAPHGAVKSKGSRRKKLPSMTRLLRTRARSRLLGDAGLRVIAHELLVSLTGNVTVDWAHRESARARMPTTAV